MVEDNERAFDDIIGVDVWDAIEAEGYEGVENVEDYRDGESIMWTHDVSNEGEKIYLRRKW